MAVVNRLEGTSFLLLTDSWTSSCTTSSAITFFCDLREESWRKLVSLVNGLLDVFLYNFCDQFSCDLREREREGEGLDLREREREREREIFEFTCRGHCLWLQGIVWGSCCFVWSGNERGGAIEKAFGAGKKKRKQNYLECRRFRRGEKIWSWKLAVRRYATYRHACSRMISHLKGM